MCFHISLVLCANRRSYVKADPHFIFVVVISLLTFSVRKKKKFEKKFKNLGPQRAMRTLEIA